MFYRAYLQWGLAGSWGKPWQPNTASNSLQHFNNAARTQLFSTFCCVPKNLRSSESLPHELLQVFAAIKTSLLLFFFFFTSELLSFKADQSPKPDWGNWSGNASRDGFQVGNRAKFFFSANEAVIYMRKKVKLYVEMHIWGDRNFKESLALIQSHSSQSLSPPSSLSSLLPPSFFILSIPLTRSLDPTSSSSSSLFLLRAHVISPLLDKNGRC